MVGTPDLRKLLSYAVMGRAKSVLVGDAYQLSPVKARGGMFEQLCADLPWSQRLGEVWRMTNREERDASLALRSAHGNRLRTAIEWYREHGRPHSGDPTARWSRRSERTRRSEPPGGQQTIAITSASEAAERSTLRSKGRHYRRRHSETTVDAGPCR